MNNLLRQLIREMAQAQTRKLGIPRTTAIDEIKTYVSDPPKYAIRESNVLRPLYNPDSKVDGIEQTPLGTYMFPLTEKIYKDLITDKLGQFSTRYIHLFKIPEQGMLYLGEEKSDISRNDIVEFMKKIDNSNENIRWAESMIYHDKSNNDQLYNLITNQNFHKRFNLDQYKQDKYYTQKRANHPKIAKALLSIGVKGFIDNDKGVIFPEEPCQMVVIDPILAQNSFIKTFDFKSLITHPRLIKKIHDYKFGFGKELKVPNEHIKKVVSDLGKGPAFEKFYDYSYLNDEIWKLYDPEDHTTFFNERILLAYKTPLHIKRLLYLYDKIDFKEKIRIMRIGDKETLLNFDIMDLLVDDQNKFYLLVDELHGHDYAYDHEEDYKKIMKHFLQKDFVINLLNRIQKNSHIPKKFLDIINMIDTAEEDI